MSLNDRLIKNRDASFEECETLLIKIKNRNDALQ